MWQAMGQDLRYALRRLAKNPGFTCLVVMILALGIGANTAIFSIVNAVLLRPLPYPGAERIVVLHETSRGGWGSVSVPDYQDWKAQSNSFESMAVYRVGGLNLTGKFAPQRVESAEVSEGFFEAFGMQPVAGRLFTKQEWKPGGPDVAVIAEGTWRGVFGGDPGLIGNSIEMSGVLYTVVGVVPEATAYPSTTRVWLPNQLDSPFARNRDTHFLSCVGRLKAGVNVEQARAELASIAGRLAKQYPETNRGRGIRVTSMLEQKVAYIRPALLVLLAAVGFVLLIACANVANLLLARAVGRQREMAVRAALGAGRRRIVRQLLTENALLAFAGAAAGLMLAEAALSALPALIPPGMLPRTGAITLDARVLAFTLLAGTLTAMLFGLAPAIASARVDPHAGMQLGGGRATQSKWLAQLRSGLMVMEVALATLLLVGGGLLIRTLGALLHVDPGFDATHVQTAEVYLPKMTPAEVPKNLDRVDRMTARLAELPGAEAASTAALLPLSGFNINSDVQIEGRPAEESTQRPMVEMRFIGPQFFHVFQIPVLQGREFGTQDNDRSHLVTVINRHMARHFWSDGSPIGRHIAFTDVNNNPQWIEIVGVCGDVHTFGLGDDVRDEAYIPFRQQRAEDISYLSGEIPIEFVIRTKGAPEALTSAIPEVVRGEDASVPVSRIETMSELLEASLSRQRFAARLLGVFGTLALLLAGAGIYAVTAYLVTERTHEMGVRMALGAKPGDVLRLVLSGGMRLALAGVFVGLGGSLAAARLLVNQLFGVTSADPATFACVAGLLTATAALACAVPASRAARVDPMVALRYE
ncbi:MAG TPA: ABC transporter permease [Candidatus Acidoferrales bacterium]|nr:ABC transporter permease [Candidatus Acidoferrales bacterium]